MFLLTDVQKVSLAIQPLDAAGNPATVDGVPAWSSSDESVVTVAPAADGLSSVASSTGKLGTAQVSVSADADLGAGTKSISGTLDIEVRASEAVSLGVTAGEPEAK